MRLHTNPASPFGRKVKVAAHELGLFDELALVEVQTSPVAPHPDLLRANPLGKIPCLELEDGVALYDSQVICEYLDHLGGEKPRLFPAEGRWRALTLHALGDGMADAALLARYENTIRPEPLRWPAWVEGQFDKIRRSLDRLEAEAAALDAERFHIGAIAVACALGYLDFRHPALAWREGRAALAGWYENVAERPSMQRTKPTA